MQYWFPTEKFHDNIDLMLTKVDFTIYIQKLKQIIIIIVLLKKKYWPWCIHEVYSWMHAFTFIGSMVEVAMTGTALPVLLSISPSYKFNFGECPVGEHADVLCTIKNESNVLPAIFQFRKIAHFLTHPPNGKIPPGQSQDVIFSFSPNQIGMSQFSFQ